MMMMIMMMMVVMIRMVVKIECKVDIMICSTPPHKARQTETQHFLQMFQHRFNFPAAPVFSMHPSLSLLYFQFSIFSLEDSFKRLSVGN